MALAALAATVAIAAEEYGTRAEAKAMLDKVVADVKTDKTGTLSKITRGEYNDRDLYPFCSGPDGKVSAHGANPKRIGVDQGALKDSAGKPFGAEIRKVARPGEIAEVEYMYARPGSSDQQPKISLVTKVGDQVCAVGFYKEPPKKK
ncbi:MAG TPA: cache domain-containing protein [Anaeromyxobacteraceae bacterium]|nr:cache domain-containing protein [Anaeromyxobacteraceae bacterium]